MPELLTPQLLLRVPNREDLDGFAAFCQDEVAMEHLGGERLSRHESWRQMCTLVGSWAVEGFGMFSVIERASGRWVGRIGPWQPADWPGTEVGWGVLTEFAGRGYAFEAAVASMDYAFDTLGWSRVVHMIAPTNVRSAALAARLGSRNEGPTSLPPPLDVHEVDCWAQTREEWRSRRSSVG